MSKKDQIQNRILRCLIPYRIAARKALIDAAGSNKERHYVVDILTDMEQRKYVEKLVLYKNAVTDNWRLTNIQKASEYQIKTGYVVERITSLGYVRLCELEHAAGIKFSQFFTASPSSISASLLWGVKLTRSDGGNRCRKKQAVVNALKDVNIDTTPFCYADIMDSVNGQWRSEAPPTTVSEAIASSAVAYVRQAGNNQSNKYAGVFIRKKEISKRKKFSMDNLMGVVITANKAYAVYHTDNYYGTSWAPEYKKEFRLEIASYLNRNSMGQKDATTALMFVSEPKEFADLLFTSHGEKSDAKKYFLGYQPQKPAGIKNIAHPFEELIVVPEQRETATYLKMIMQTKNEETEEALFSSALTQSFPDGVYNLTADMKAYEGEVGLQPTFSFPENEVEKIMFLQGSFPFSAVLSSSPDAQIFPVFLGYVMDLTRISRAYYFYKKTALIGTTTHEGEEQRALVIACFAWQVRWYKRLFPDAIYITGENGEKNKKNTINNS